MPSCKECKSSYGFLQLTQGVCKNCIDKRTPPCISCRKNFETTELIDGYCQKCHVIQKNREAEDAKSRERLNKEKQLELTSDAELDAIILTTEGAPDLEIIERIEIITAECAFGMNLFKDFFAGVRDIVGGRSKSTQNVLRDARKTVLGELKKEAFSVGANAVVGVDLDYSEFSGGGKSMLFVVASGTAVKLKI